MTNLAQQFQMLTGFHPRPFQQQTIAHLLKNTSVILRSPTGSGKTETAIAPFLIAQTHPHPFPRRLIYGVPLRTLAQSLCQRAEALVDRWFAQQPPGCRRPVVTLQTGETPDDPRFEGDIIFCTIDQLLSSYLNIPYSVGRGSGNVNAGAILAAYVVFDEVHLLEPQRSLTTMIKLLQERGPDQPFLIMTATMTQTLITTLRQTIQPQDPGRIVSVEPTPAELMVLTAGRSRTVAPLESPLTAAQVWQDYQDQPCPRTLIICNTIALAQRLYQQLCDLQPTAAVTITLLHSRFLPGDRTAKAATLQTQFGPHPSQPHILIATQVIEVGLNISCERLYTQLAPINTLVQRFGRCARFPQETGQVWVFRQVAMDDAAPDPPSFAPYDHDRCEATWAILQTHPQDQAVDFPQELRWLEAVHQAEDGQAAQVRQQNAGEFERQFCQATQQGDRSVIPHLIRATDSRPLYSLNDQPLFFDDTAPTPLNPDEYHPFTLPIRTLHGLFAQAKAALTPQDWLFKAIERPRRSETYAQPSLIPIHSYDDLAQAAAIVINPRYVSYSDAIGLRIDLDGGAGYESPRRPAAPTRDDYTYRMDTYVAHLACLGRAWREPFAVPPVVYGSVRSAVLGLGGRVVQRFWLPGVDEAIAAEVFESLVYLAIWGHDLGKLQTSWQQGMRGWQTQAYQQFQGRPPRDHLLAHTDYDPQVPGQREALRDYERRHKRPNHAVESAFLFAIAFSAAIAPRFSSQFGMTAATLQDFGQVVLLAIARHHSAWAQGWRSRDCPPGSSLQLHPRAQAAIARSWQIQEPFLPVWLRGAAPQLAAVYPRQPLPLAQFPLARSEFRLLYALVVRGLRLADSRSVQLS